MKGSSTTGVEIFKTISLYLYVLVFVSLIDSSTVAPVISSYARSIGASAEIAGLIVGVYSIAALLSYPIIGFLLDYLPRARVLLVFYAADTLMVSLYMFSRDPVQLLLVRFFHGFFDAAVFPSSIALFRDLISERFGSRFSVYWAVAATPLLVGSLVTRALVVWLGFHAVFIFVVLLMLLGLYSSYRLDIIQEDARLKAFRESSETRSVKLSTPSLLISYLSAFALFTMTGSIVGSMSSRIAELYGTSKEMAAGEVALWNAVATTVSIPTVLGVTRCFLDDQRGAVRGLVLGLLTMVFSSLLLVISLETWVRYSSSVLFGFSLALILPTTSRVVAEMPYRFRGRASAALGASYRLGVALGAPLSSALLKASPLYNTSFLPSLILSAAVLLAVSHPRFRRFS